MRVHFDNIWPLGEKMKRFERGLNQIDPERAPELLVRQEEEWLER